MAEATLQISAGSPAGVPGVRYVDRGALGQNRIVDVAPDDPSAAAFVGCGQPRGGEDIVVVDPATRRVCGPDEIGEIWIAGPNVAPGYWNRPCESAAAFGGYVAETGAGPYLRTGDLGFVAGGEVFPTGRWADLVVIDGHNYYPNDIEATVAACHRVLVSGRGAAFTVTPIAGALEQLVVVQEVDAGGVDLAGVIAAIKAAIPAHHTVTATAVVLVAPLSLPTTSSGKIRRGACRQQFLDNETAIVAQWRAADDLTRADRAALADAVAALQARAVRPG